MLKKLLCALLLGLSMSLSAVEVSRTGSVTLSDWEMKSSSDMIVREVNRAFSAENTEEIMNEMIKAQLNDNDPNAALTLIFSAVLKNIMDYTTFKATSIHYLSDNSANVTIQFRIPDIGNGNYEQDIADTFKRKSGISFEQLGNMSMDEQETERYLSIIIDSVNEVVSRVLRNNKKYATYSEVYRFDKVAGKWQTDTLPLSMK